jgi:ABC-type sugar transport system permease subunit
MRATVASSPAEARRGKSTLRRVWDARVSYAFLTPSLLLVLLFMYWPTFSGMFYAFTDWQPGLERLNFVGLANFAAMLEDEYLRTGFVNVGLIVATTVLKDLTVPLLVAELIFHLRWPRLQYWLRTLFVVPMVMPGIAVILLWVQIYDPNIGLLNQLLDALGLAAWERSWLGEEGVALWSIVFLGFPWVSVLPFLIYLGGLMAVPQEIFDAAIVDGAGPLSRLWRIDVPLLLGQIKLLVVLAVIQGMQAFFYILVMTQGGPFHSTTVPALEMYYAAFQHSKYGYACAIATVLFAVVMAITVANMTYLKSSVDYEA